MGRRQQRVGAVVRLFLAVVNHPDHSVPGQITHVSEVVEAVCHRQIVGEQLVELLDWGDLVWLSGANVEHAASILRATSRNPYRT